MSHPKGVHAKSSARAENACLLQGALLQQASVCRITQKLHRRGRHAFCLHIRVQLHTFFRPAALPMVLTRLAMACASASVAVGSSSEPARTHLGPQLNASGPDHGAAYEALQIRETNEHLHDALCAASRRAKCCRRHTKHRPARPKAPGVQQDEKTSRKESAH